MKKIICLLAGMICLTSCGLKKSEIINYEYQIDSLNSVIIENEVKIQEQQIKIDSLTSVIDIKETECKSHLNKIEQYKDLVDEYKTVLYAIVGEDGLYNYGDIDYD